MPRASSFVASMVLFVAAAALRRWQLRWGATDAETEQPLAGDELVPNPNLTATRAITIHAGVDDVWPWIAQLGQGRGGFYSYDRLENLAGCGIHSALQINPDWQHLEVGEPVRLAPEFALTVAVAKPPHTLVLRGDTLPGTAIPPYDFTWTFLAGRIRLFATSHSPDPLSFVRASCCGDLLGNRDHWPSAGGPTPCAEMPTQ